MEATIRQDSRQRACGEGEGDYGFGGYDIDKEVAVEKDAEIGNKAEDETANTDPEQDWITEPLANNKYIVEDRLFVNSNPCLPKKGSMNPYSNEHVTQATGNRLRYRMKDEQERYSQVVQV